MKTKNFLFIICFILFAFLMNSCKESYSKFDYEKIYFEFDSEWRGLRKTDFPKDLKQSRIKLFSPGFQEVFVVNKIGSFSFPIKIPAGFPVLEFECGIAKGDKKKNKGNWEFIVSIDNTVVFRKTLSLENAYKRKWALRSQEDIPLREFRGDKVNISFTVKPVKVKDKTDAKVWWRRIYIKEEKSIKRRKSNKKNPNIICVLVDCLRDDHLGYRGYNRNVSPFIDSLASKSLVFQDTYTTTTWTWPATASLLTGLNPLEHGVIHRNSSYLDHEIRTIAEHLQLNGFTTLGISANSLITPKYNFDQGFETFIEHTKVGKRNASVLNKAFKTWLDKFEKFQFFAYIHYMDVHSAYEAPMPYFSRYIDEKKGRSILKVFEKVSSEVNAKKNYSNVTEDFVSGSLALYDAEIAYFDSQLEKLFKLLESKKLARKTIICLISDHGEEFMEHGLMKHGLDLYNECLRIPFFLYYPGKIEAKISEKKTNIMDVFPTLCHLANIPVPKNIRGKNLLSEYPGFDDLAVSTFYGFDPKHNSTQLHALLENSYKLIYKPQDETFKLFNIKKDPGERKDLASEESNITARMRDKLLRKINDMQNVQRTLNITPDKETIRRLKALGYIH